MCYNETLPFPLNPLSAVLFTVDGEGSYMNIYIYIYDLLYVTQRDVCKQATGTHF